MTWDPVWEKIFRSRDWGRYPPEELVRFIATHFQKTENRHNIKILELGSGTGANVWYLAREGFDVFGIDGSASGIRKTRKRLKDEGLKASLRQGDLIHLGRFYSIETFDAIIDVSSLQHNALDTIESILRQAFPLLKPNGKMFSKLISLESWGGAQRPEGSREGGTSVASGLWEERFCHYSTIEEVRRTFSVFSDLECNYVKYSTDHQKHRVEFWTVVGTKR